MANLKENIYKYKEKDNNYDTSSNHYEIITHKKYIKSENNGFYEQNNVAYIILL